MKQVVTLKSLEKVNLLTLFIPFLTLFFLCTACSRIPQPVAYPYNEQHKMQAAHHWDVLADDVANQINKSLIRNDYLETPVLLKKVCGDDDTPCAPGETTVFNESFHDLLTTRLVNFGVPTSAVQDPKAIVVHYKVQIIYHNTNRLEQTFPGSLTILSMAVAVLRDAPSALQTIALAAGLDLANHGVVQSGHYEVIITTSMITEKKYLFRQSDIYYINDPDFWHYQKGSGALAKEIELTSVE